MQRPHNKSVKISMGEVFSIKGMYFRVVDFDTTEGEISLRQISQAEAVFLRKIRKKKKSMTT